MQASNNDRPVTPVIDENKDPLTGTHGAHPVGTGLGAIGAGAAAGAIGGALGGPIGAIAGAAIGAVAGGLVGKAAAEVVNPTVEDRYWKSAHSSMPYAHSHAGYDEFAPAYRYGWESYASHGSEGRTFESVETELGRGWEKFRGTSRLAWHQAKDASRDAWNRVQTAVRSTTRRVAD